MEKTFLWNKFFQTHFAPNLQPQPILEGSQVIFEKKFFWKGFWKNGKIVKTAYYVSVDNFWGKNFFEVENFYNHARTLSKSFLNFVLNLSGFFLEDFLFLAAIFPQSCQKYILRVPRNACRQKSFLKKLLQLIIFGLWTKKNGNLTKKFQEGCQNCSQRAYMNILDFSKLFIKREQFAYFGQHRWKWTQLAVIG